MKLHENKINEWLIIEQNQFDALVMFRYNMGNIVIFLDCIKNSKPRNEWDKIINEKTSNKGLKNRYKVTLDLYFENKYIN